MLAIKIKKLSQKLIYYFFATDPNNEVIIDFSLSFNIDFIFFEKIFNSEGNNKKVTNNRNN